MRTLTASILLLLVLIGSGCDSSTEPPPVEPDRFRLVVVKGQVRDTTGSIFGPFHADIELATNNADCTGHLFADTVVQGESGAYWGEAGIPPGVADSRRCVWVIVRPTRGSSFPIDTLGGKPATLRFRSAGVPLDTVEIDVLLRGRAR